MDGTRKKNCSASPAIRKNAIRKHIRYQFIPVRMIIVKEIEAK